MNSSNSLLVRIEGTTFSKQEDFYQNDFFNM